MASDHLSAWLRGRDGHLPIGGARREAFDLRPVLHPRRVPTPVTRGVDHFFTVEDAAFIEDF